MSSYKEPGYNDHPVWQYSKRSFNTVDPDWAAEMVSLPHTPSATEGAVEALQPELGGIPQAYVQREFPEVLFDEASMHDPRSKSMAPDKYKGYISDEIADLVVAYNYSEEINPLELVEPSRVSRIAERMAMAAGTILSTTTQNLGVSTLRWFAFDKIVASKNPVGKHRLEKAAKAPRSDSLLSAR